MALVRQIVKLSGGRLGVKSKVGEGSTFWVELPLGVGRKTLIASTLPDLESQQGSNTTDLEKVCAAAETRTSLPTAMSNSLGMAVDAAALRASQAPSVSPRSSAAMHGLMEQGDSDCCRFLAISTKSKYYRRSCRVDPSATRPTPSVTDSSVFRRTDEAYSH